MNRPIALLLVVLALFSNSACSSYQVAESSIRLRYVPEEDVLLVLEVQVGIVSRERDEQGLGHAAEDLSKATSGSRVYPPQGGLPAFDFDDDPGPERRAESWYPDLLEIRKLVHVEKSRVLLDKEGRLCFARLTCVDKFQRFLEVVNAFLNREFKEDKSGTPTGSEFPAFDEPTAVAMHTAIASNHAWLGIKDGAFVLDLPMTQANAARCFAWIARENAKAKDRSWQVILDAVSSIEIAGDHALIRFSEAPEHTTLFIWKDDVEGYDRALRKELAKRNLSIGDESTLNEVRKLFDAKPAPTAENQFK